MHLEDLGVDEYNNKMDLSNQIYLAQVQSAAGSHEHSSTLPRSIRRGIFHEHVRTV